jgi:uncharacterized membrane protein
MNANLQGDANLAHNKGLTNVIYALYAVSLVNGLTFFVAVVLNYVKRDDVVGSFLESHFRWQIRTFWFTCLWAIISFITIPLLGVGFAIGFATFVWFVYRIVKGWLRLNEDKSMYVVTSAPNA